MCESPRQRRLVNFAKSLDRWTDETDTSLIPPYIQALISTPARDVQGTSCPQRVSTSASLHSVLETFQGVRTVIVQPDTDDIRSDPDRELIFNRLVFLEHALSQNNLSEPLSSLLQSIPAIGWVQGHETLDVVLQRMLATGFEEVGVMDGGLVTGVLHVDDIFKFLSKEMSLLGYGHASKSDTNFTFEGRDDLSLQVESSADVKERMDKQKKQHRMSPLQLFAQQFCKAYWTEVLIVICILLDVCCSVYVYDTSLDSVDDLAEQKLEVATGIILFVFLYEAVVRVYGFRTALLRLPFEIIDLIIVMISVVVYCMILQSVVTSESKSLVTLTRIIRGLRMFKLVKLIVGMIMKQRMLYNRDGFALDISFITKSCIAMSIPAVGSHANFGNPIEEVCRFFQTKFPDRYLIFNLCTKATYSDEYFAGRVERIAVEKHNPPKFGQMVAFVQRAGQFMDEDPKACIAVHCKSGRDRTGVMVCAWLLYSTFAESADDAMGWFVARRIRDKAGIAEGIPMASQQRYIRYMQDALKYGGYYTKRLLVKRLVIKTCPMMDAQRGCHLWLTIDEDGREVYRSSGRGNEAIATMTQGDEQLAFDVDMLVAGDVRITVYNREPASGRDDLCFFFCFHTGFVSVEEIFPKEGVDIASSDSKCKVFRKDFAVHVVFDCVAEEGVPLPAAAIRNGAALGPFRKIKKPTQRVIDVAVQMRGRDLEVQKKSAMRLKKKVKSGLESVKVEGMDLADSCEEVNLCCAGGPTVQHDSVDLFQSGDSAVPAMSRHGSRTFSASKYLANSIGAKIARSLVSGNKRRFVEDGFDLDLSYITARVIAMGFPSSGLESSYRNAKEDVYRFFQERHAAHYRIVNLCSERAYSLDTFHGNCVRYPFPDHNPPALELILPCCAHIHKFLQADPDNVIAIHCKAGKGRTGLIVVCYLMYCGLKNSAAESRAFYDWARTTDGKGLTIISQIRYAHYFEQLLRIIKEGHDPLETSQDRAQAVVLHRFRLHTIPHFNSDGGCTPSVTVLVKSELDHQDYTIFKSSTLAKSSLGGNSLTSSVAATGGSIGTKSAQKVPTMDFPTDDGLGNAGTRVAGDFRVMFEEESKSKTMFFFAMHSALLTSPPSEMGGKSRQLTDEECEAEGLAAGTWVLTLCKHEIDRAAKDSRCAHFDPDFHVEIFFTELIGESGTGPALEAARAAALEDSALAARERPLRRDRDAYAAATRSLAAAGRPIPSFEDWLLGSGPSPSGLSRSPSTRSHTLSSRSLGIAGHSGSNRILVKALSLRGLGRGPSQRSPSAGRDGNAGPTAGRTASHPLNRLESVDSVRAYPVTEGESEDVTALSVAASLKYPGEEV